MISNIHILHKNPKNTVEDMEMLGTGKSVPAMLYCVRVDTAGEWKISSEIRSTRLHTMSCRPKDGTPDQISAKIVGKLFEKNIF